MMIGKSLGIWIEEDSIELSLLSRSWKRRVRVAGILKLETLSAMPAGEARRQVDTFLGRHGARDCRKALMIPRRQVIVRQVDLPAEAETNLAKAVEYQVVGLLPDAESQVSHGYTVVRNGKASKTLRISIYLLSRPILDGYLETCRALGLVVDRVLPSSVALSSWRLSLGSGQKRQPCLLGHWKGGRLELLAIGEEDLLYSRELAAETPETVVEILQKEADQFAGKTGLSDSASVEVGLLNASDLTPEDPTTSLKLRMFSDARSLGLEVSQPKLNGRTFIQSFLSIAGGLSGFRRTLPHSINLLPFDQRIRKSRWRQVPTYALLAANGLLALALALRQPYQEARFARELRQEVARLEPEVKRVRSVESEIADAQRKVALLARLKDGHRFSLEALNEMSTIIPKDTAVFDYNFKSPVIEIYGSSVAAAGLPQLLDNSKLFKETEFVAPITRDASQREIYRIRTKLETGTGSVPPESPAQGIRGKK
ncbi:MAG: PilN domain-containing protein [Acidobacteriota bacterium]